MDLCIPKLPEGTNAAADYERPLWYADANDSSNMISDIGRGEVSNELLAAYGDKEQRAETCALNRA